MSAPTLGVAVSGAGDGSARFGVMSDLARRAEAAGLGSVWTNELYTHSATVGMAVLAGATRRVAIGSGIAYGVGRSPLIWAAEARDLDRLSDGRIVLGLGDGTSRAIWDWHGQDGAQPAHRMEEFVDLFRLLWRLDRGPVNFDGRFHHVKVHPTAEMEPPLSSHLPVYLAGVNPRMIQSAGRVADGIIGHPMFTARYVDDVVLPAISIGAAARGRDAESVQVVRQVMCSVDTDLTVARARLAFAIAQYATSRVFDRLFELHGWSSERDAIRNAVRSGDPVAIARSVPDWIVDEIGVACRPEDLTGLRLSQRNWGTVSQVTLGSPPWGMTPERTVENVDTIIAAFDRVTIKEEASR